MIIVGDFNAHMGDDKEGISGNHKKMGTNGVEYRKMIKEKEIFNATCYRLCW